MPDTTRVFYPGKLYLAGEYAVVTGKSPAIILPVKNGTTCTVKDSDDFRLTTTMFAGRSFGFRAATPDTSLSELPYVQHAIRTVKTILKEKEIPFTPVHIDFSDTQHTAGRIKTGTGSSASTTLAVIGGLLTHFGIDHEPLALFKAAVLSQYRAFPDSSFGDLAVSAHGKAIFYNRFHSAWLDVNLDKDISWLMHTPWPGLITENPGIFLPPVLVVNTGQPASSSALVRAVMSKKDSGFFETFTLKTKTAVHELRAAMHQKDSFFFLKTIRELKDALEVLEKESGVPLTTDPMREIEKIAAENGGTMKFSGAGGGDNVFLFFENDTQKNKTRHELENAGYLMLDDALGGF